MEPINHDRKLYVYRNLRRNCLSLQQSRLVVGHAEAVILQDVEFRVRESGRQRVLQERRKNVHAFVIGVLEEAFETPYTWVLDANKTFDRANTRAVSYNPYRFPTFFDTETLKPINSSKRVLVTTNNIWVEE